jgi:tRNA pseudouridine13 synthase
LRPPKGSEPFEKGSDPFGGRLRAIRDEGVPNYFGEQRFGRSGANIALVDRWAAGGRLPRHQRSIAMSCARSCLFNELLAARVVDKSWDTLVAGDVANLDGSGSVFDVDVVDDSLRTRVRELDIHPAGLLWGDGAAADSVPPGHEDWLSALAKARVKPARRALRLKVLDFKWQIDKDSLILEFGLTSGAFATSVIRELANTTDSTRQYQPEETH